MHAKKANVTVEMAIEEMASLFLERKDPIEKAKRAKPRNQTLPSSGRSTPASARHEVNRRDLGRCQARLPNYEPCGSGLWAEQHHVQPKHLGGPDIPENLITLLQSAPQNAAPAWPKARWNEAQPTAPLKTIPPPRPPPETPPALSGERGGYPRRKVRPSYHNTAVLFIPPRQAPT